MNRRIISYFVRVNIIQNSTPELSFQKKKPILWYYIVVSCALDRQNGSKCSETDLDEITYRKINTLCSHKAVGINIAWCRVQKNWLYPFKTKKGLDWPHFQYCHIQKDHGTHAVNTTAANSLKSIFRVRALSLSFNQFLGNIFNSIYQPLER